MASQQAPPAKHPFETDPGDHAETPFEAYQHVEPLLARLATRLGTTKAELKVYDPFYCEGRMVEHMAALGFDSVTNRNEDFYAAKAAGALPHFDVLLTNPPFSSDHLERVFKFAVGCRRRAHAAGAHAPLPHPAPR
ncbi:MAG: hypothetical protein J3K34DRAFT_145652 [Monoraphidium minutum]|nr:MAG: hypothetical protein J3K34DRAFT_145652 [Monoraphidium minutum]